MANGRTIGKLALAAATQNSRTWDEANKFGGAARGARDKQDKRVPALAAATWGLMMRYVIS